MNKNKSVFRWVSASKRLPLVAGKYFTMQMGEKSVGTFTPTDQLCVHGWKNAEGLKWLEEVSVDVKGNDMQVLQDRMRQYFARVTPEEVVKKFEAMGYEFVPVLKIKT